MDYLLASTLKLNELRKSKLFTDIEIECVDKGEKFPAHSVVLASCSGFFRSLLTLRLQDTDNAPNIRKPKSKSGMVSKDVIAIRRKIVLEIPSDAMEKLLDFMYTGRLYLNLDADKLRELIFSSQRLRMPHFTAYVAQTLRSILSVENYSLLWDLSAEFDQREIRDEVVKFIANGFSEFSKSKEFLEMPFARLKLIYQHLQNDATTHDDLLAAILVWIKHDLQNREKDLPLLLRFVNTTRLSSVYIAVLVKSEPLVRKNDRFWRTLSSAHVERCSIMKPRQVSPVRTLFPPCNVSSIAGSTVGELFGRSSSAGKRSLASAACPGLQLARAFDDDILSPRSRLFLSKSKQYCHDSLFALDLQMDAMGDSPNRTEDGGENVISQNYVSKKLQFDLGTLAILGRSRNSNTLMQFFCLKRKTWHLPEDPCEMFTRLNYTLPIGAATAVSGCLFLLLGGLLGVDNVLSTVMVYDFETSTFSKRSDMKYPRYNAGAAILDGFVYVIGGMGPVDRTSHSERNLLCKDLWEEVAPLPFPAEQVTSSVVDKLIYCLSICERSSCQTACFYYNPKTDQWTQLNSLPERCVYNSRLLMCVYNNQLYTVIRRNTSALELVIYNFDENGRRWQLVRCSALGPERPLMAMVPNKKGLWTVDVMGTLCLCNLQKKQWEKERYMLPVFITPFYVGVLKNS